MKRTRMIRLPNFLLPMFVLGSMCLATHAQTRAQVVAQAPDIKLEKNGDGISVSFDGQLFTEFVPGGYAKPILYPVFSKGQIPMVRNWPMKEVPGEAHDHPHHKSIWFAHGSVNGFDFWSEKAKIVNVSFGIDGSSQSIVATNEWQSDDAVELVERVRYRFGGDHVSRWLDVDTTLSNDDRDVEFGDTKEGMMAIRVHPSLRLKPDPRNGVEKVTGSIINSNGDRDEKVWGRAAKWVRYDGRIEGTPVAILILDHPGNLRHPTPWHARDYGLFAANPFGLHDFGLGAEKTGDYSLPKGKKLRFRYRLIFANLDQGELDSNAAYEAYSGTDQ